MNGKPVIRSSPQLDVAAMKRFGIWWQKYQQARSKPTTKDKSQPKVA